MPRAAVTVAGGVEGDFRGAPGGRQITIVFAEDWAKTVAAIDPAANWTLRRANLLVEGVANPRAPGGVLSVGPVLLLVTGETTPCKLMEQQLAGLRDALKPEWRGGVTAQVMSDGEITVGDPVKWEG